MAEYEYASLSKKVKIAESYIKLNIDYNSENVKEITAILKKASETYYSLNQSFERNIKSDVYFKGITIQVETEEGSFKTRVVVYATLAFGIITGFGALDDGVKSMIERSKQATEYVMRDSQHGKINQDTIIRTEKRVGITGRLKNTIERIHYLRTNAANLNPNQTQAELTKLEQDLSNMLVLLEEQERKKVIDSMFLELGNNLPEPTTTGVKHMSNLYSPQN